jgi:hypothetical protein
MHAAAVLLFIAAAALGTFSVNSASAHNAGHIFLPTGKCLEIGSFKESPNGLDLIPETPNPPFDEYGASFAAFQGNTPILPGACP